MSAMKKTTIKKQSAAAWLLLAPALILYVWLVLVPMLQTIYISFTEWEGIGPKSWTGVSNYVKIFSETELPVIWSALKNNLIWFAVAVTIPVWIGLYLSNILVRGRVRGGKFFQMVYFMPQVVSMIVIAIAWKWLYNPLFGPLNGIFGLFGLHSKAGLLSDKSTVLFALLFIYCWMSFGYSCLLYTVAIENIDPQIYEAAKLDGASPAQEFFRITIPSVRGTTTTITLLMMISSFKAFDLVYSLTNGGPANSSNVISLYAYKEGFIYSRMGYASAVTVAVSVLLLGLAQGYLRLRRRKDDEEVPS